jgi:hypothetical protein
MRNKILLLSLVLLSSRGLTRAANIPYSNSGAWESPEDFRIEITASSWLINSSGTISSSTTPINLVRDLGVKQQQPNFYGKLVFKPRRKHRIVVEGIPFSLNGYNTSPRSFTYRNRTFSVLETLKSSANADYIFGGYQYDVVSGPTGHIGITAGAALLSGTGTMTAVQSNVTATRSGVGAIPLVGTEFRVFPLRNRGWLNVNGSLRGMELGQYGHYLEGSLNGGVWIGSIGVEAGYRAIDTHLAQANSSTGVFARLSGPVFSVNWRW